MPIGTGSYFDSVPVANAASFVTSSNFGFADPNTASSDLLGRIDLGIGDRGKGGVNGNSLQPGEAKLIEVLNSVHAQLKGRLGNQLSDTELTQGLIYGLGLDGYYGLNPNYSDRIALLIDSVIIASDDARLHNKDLAQTIVDYCLLVRQRQARAHFVTGLCVVGAVGAGIYLLKKSNESPTKAKIRRSKE